MVDADDLVIFLEVARRGRLTEAAQQLGLNHTTVGRHISQLERSTEQRLFSRDPGGWVLTEAGVRLLSHAEAVEAALIAANEDCLRTGEHLTGTVRIVAPDGFGAHLLLPRLADVKQFIGGLTVEVVTANRHASLTSREFDLAVTIERPEARGVNVRRLADYVLHFYGSPEYLRDKKPVSAPEEMAEEHSFIWYVDQALGSETFEALYNLVPTAEPQYSSNNITAQIGAAQHGLGLALLPSYIGDAEPGLDRVPGFDVGFPRSYWLLVPSNFRRLARVMTIADALERLVGQTPGLTPGSGQ